MKHPCVRVCDAMINSRQVLNIGLRHFAAVSSSSIALYWIQTSGSCFRSLLSHLHPQFVLSAACRFHLPPLLPSQAPLWRLYGRARHHLAHQVFDRLGTCCHAACQAPYLLSNPAMEPNYLHEFLFSARHVFTSHRAVNIIYALPRNLRKDELQQACSWSRPTNEKSFFRRHDKIESHFCQYFHTLFSLLLLLLMPALCMHVVDYVF